MCVLHAFIFVIMVRVFKRGESRVTFCTVKCFSTGGGFHTKMREYIFRGTVKRRTVNRLLIIWLYVSKKKRERLYLKIRTILQKECSITIRVTAQNVKVKCVNCVFSDSPRPVFWLSSACFLTLPRHAFWPPPTCPWLRSCSGGWTRRWGSRAATSPAWTGTAAWSPWPSAPGSTGSNSRWETHRRKPETVASVCWWLKIASWIDRW